MKAAIFSIITLPLIICASCEKQDSNVTREPINLTTEQKQIVSSSNSFGLNIFKHVYSNAEEGKNIFVSPLSMSLALSMLYNGSATITKDELQQGLGYVGLTDEQVNISNRDLIKALINADPKVKMEIANSIWYRNTFQAKQSFLATNKDFLNAEVRSANFDNATKNAINSWVSDATHDKITSIIDEIPNDAIMYLINAIYFKGIWKYTFDSKNNQMLDFTMLSGSKKRCEFMVQESTFETLKNELFTAVNMPYGDGNFSMMVFVPNADKTNKDIIEALNQQNWATWNNSLKRVDKLKIYFPKFKFSYKNTLNDELYALGMKSMFTDDADLTGINETEDIYVSEVKHKTFVEVNEEGTEAAAVTSVEIKLTSAITEPLEIKADRPFLFVIKEKQSNALLFMGVLNEPVIEN